MAFSSRAIEIAALTLALGCSRVCQSSGIALPWTTTDTTTTHKRFQSMVVQGLAWVLPVLDRPENQRAVEGLHVNTAVGQPALTAALPAGRQATVHRQPGLPATKADGFTQQEPGHHPGQKHQMALIAGRAVLTQEADQLSMQLGTGCHGDLVWFRNPTLSWLSAHPLS